MILFKLSCFPCSKKYSSWYKEKNSKSLIKDFMLHSKASVTTKKIRKNLGFSLIELLVVVAIIGILAAVAIPAYNQYRKTAALGAMSSDATNIVRAVTACLTVNPFSSCDELTDTKLGLNTQGVSGGITGKAPNVCFHFPREIAGTTYSQCVSVDASTSKSTAVNSNPFCHIESVANACADQMQIGSATCSLHANNIECNNDSDCPDAVSPATAKCVSGQKGECKSDATCG